MILDPNFWFRVPSIRIESGDLVLGYFFAGLTILGIALWVTRMFAQHEILKKLLSKIYYLSFVVGILGLFWFALRYENTPIFSTRYWPGIILLFGLIWAGFVLKYIVFGFRKESREYEAEQIKKKYLPGR